MRPERRDPAAEKIAVKPSGGSDKPLSRTFPGPRGADAALRVAIERRAYAELIAHAKESLDAEVCGVLVGHVCEDDEGRFVHVEAIIRGSAASQGATHVTFTQATWDAIHTRLEREYPKSRILGWYHTHPGFGVEFSEMDLFIQRNFFPGAEQIALVTDPMSGAVAIAINGARGIEYLPRVWVDAREQEARAPASVTPAKPAGRNAGNGSAVSGDVAASVRDLEARMSQLLQAYDEQRTSYQRFLYTVGFSVCFALVVAVGYFIYSQYMHRLEPPRLGSYVPVPIRVGDKTLLVGISVVNWEVPPELDALVIQTAKEEVEQRRKEAAAKGLPPPGTAPATPSANPNSKP